MDKYSHIFSELSKTKEINSIQIYLNYEAITNIYRCILISLLPKSVKIKTTFLTYFK